MGRAGIRTPLKTYHLKPIRNIFGISLKLLHFAKITLLLYKGPRRKVQGAGDRTPYFTDWTYNTNQDGCNIY